MTVVCSVSLSMGSPRQEYWSRLPFPTPGDLPNPGIELVSLAPPALASGFFTLCHPGNPCLQNLSARKEKREEIFSRHTSWDFSPHIAFSSSHNCSKLFIWFIYPFISYLIYISFLIYPFLVYLYILFSHFTLTFKHNVKKKRPC